MQIIGAKKGAGKQQKPNIAKDSAASTNFFHGLYGLSEGEILGLVDGGKSIKLDGTPIINDNGQPNFPDIQWDFRSGTIEQEHITGFGGVHNERGLNVEIRHNRAFTQRITNTKLDAVVIRLSWGALRETKDNGDVVGYRIDYAIDVQTDGGTWRAVQAHTINDKTSNGYQRSHRVDLPKAKRGWTVRVRRITPNRDTDLISDTMNIVAITEVIDAKLRYPCTALLSLKYDAETFSNIAKIAVRAKGMIIRVPTNYDPERRTYSGIWDGTFKMAYTNNPAWIFYDLCTAKRYGLGHRLADKVDKWALYSLAQYCDELVDDGQGGQEPRFTCNVYLQKAEDAYKVLQNIASVFRAMSYWNGTHVVVDADTPKDPVYTFSTSNVVNGEFVYTGTRARDRHTIAKVAYDDPDNDFKTEYVMVRDDFAIAKYGISIVDINAFGCTSRGQAERAGVWALNSEQLETQTVSFKTGLQGFIPSVGQVINIADNVRAGRAITGKIQAVNKRQITLDRVAGKVGDTFVDENGNIAKITAIKDSTITIDKTPTAQAGQIWAIKSDDLHLAQFRVMSISQHDDDTFSITALQYEPTKYRLTDTGARQAVKPISVIKPTVLSAPETVGISQSSRVLQGQSVTTMTVNWSQVVGAVAYIVEWRKDDNAWINQKVASQSIDIDGVYQGVYQARVRAIDAFDNESLATSSTQTRITGKQGKPATPTLTVKPLLFGVDMAWAFGVGSGDTAYTVIEQSPDRRTNISPIGQFAYPTDSHQITGLQGGATYFYRAKVVDKLGNASDWSAWQQVTTSADTSEIMRNLSLEIDESMLNQALTAKIDSINGLNRELQGVKSSVQGINVQDINRQLTQARNDIRTATNNLATERTRINNAIRDINALQADKDAKTQELANLTTTVGNHTTSLREIGVTTRDLTAKYTQLKTASDKATADITAEQRARADADSSLASRITALDTAYKQADRDVTARLAREESARANADNANAQNLRTLESTVNGINGKVGTAESKIANLERTTSDQQQALATAQTELNARFDNLSVGSRNLLLASDTNLTAGRGRASNNSSFVKRLEIAPNVNWQGVTQLTLSYFVSFAGLARHGTGSHRLGAEVIVEFDGDSTPRSLSAWIEPPSENKNGRHSVVLQVPSDKRLKNVLRAFIAIQALTAQGDIVVSRPQLEIGNVATDWKPAVEDTNVDLSGYATTASLNEYKQSQATKDNATAQRIDALNSDYQGNKSSVNNQLSTLSRNDSTQTQKLTQFESNLNGKADARALSTLDTKVTQIDGTVKSQAQKLTQLESSNGNLNTKVRETTQTMDGVKAIRTVTVDNNGVISGYGLTSELINGRVTSRFGINADSFYLGNPANGKKPFIVNTRPTTINGVQYPAGTFIDSAFIANASINFAKISDSIQSDNYVQGRSGWRLYKNGELEINSSFNDGTKVQLTSRGLVGYYANGKKAFELGVFE